MTGLFVVLAASAPATGYAQSTEEGTFPIRYAARPLTLVDGLFRLDFFGGGGRIDRTDLAFQLSAGAGYGISDDFEIGLVLIDAVLSPAQDSGLAEPSGYLRYRLLSGVVQAAAEIQGALPTDGRWRFTAATPMLIAIAQTVRFDLRPEIIAAQVPDWTTFWAADALVSVQLLDTWRIFAGARWIDEISGPTEPLVSPVGGLVFTLRSGARPVGDFEARVQGPAQRWGSERTIPRNLDSDWFFTLAYRPFIRSERSRLADDPFETPEGW